MLALPRCVDKARPAQDLQMARGVGERQPGNGRQLINAARPLGYVLQQLNPMRMTDSLRDAGQTCVDGLLGPSLRHTFSPIDVCAPSARTHRAQGLESAVACNPLPAVLDTLTGNDQSFSGLIE
ncbi:hypothetical protein CO2235_U600032 [Cupriavidus oxalaticus]|uniref:Uncharacterized protein n=1 Tax=Cupriavidus oxalaticus TaxID=96344 RepID=A0A375FLL5_9BURK|nr:hypothetical protein CO2235_U600032 [Cupriavidus oxalaticus]